MKKKTRKIEIEVLEGTWYTYTIYLDEEDTTDPKTIMENFYNGEYEADIDSGDCWSITPKENRGKPTTALHIDGVRIWDNVNQFEVSPEDPYVKTLSPLEDKEIELVIDLMHKYDLFDDHGFSREVGSILEFGKELLKYKKEKDEN